MKKILITTSIVLSVILLSSPALVKADPGQESYAQCVIEKTYMAGNGIPGSTYGGGADFISSVFYSKIEECNALPDAPAIVPTNMKLNAIQLAIVAANPLSEDAQNYYFYPSITGFFTSLPSVWKPDSRIAPGSVTGTDTYAWPKTNVVVTPPTTTDQSSSSSTSSNDSSSNSNPIITGVTTPPVSNGYTTCPTDNSAALSAQVSSYEQSNSALVTNNTSLAAQVSNLQNQVTGDATQITNLTEALSDANAKLKESSNATIEIPIAPAVQQVPVPAQVVVPDAAPVAPPVVTPVTQNNVNIIHRFTNWISNIF